MAIKNWMVVVWHDLKEMPEVGGVKPISPRGKLIINEADYVSWEETSGDVVVAAYHNDIPLGFGSIEDGVATIFADPMGNAIYGHGTKRRAVEMVDTLLSAFRRFAYKETKVADQSKRHRKSPDTAESGDIKDQTPSYKRTVSNGQKSKKDGTARKAKRALHQVSKYERDGCWCTIKKTGTRYWRSGGTVEGHWAGEGAKELNAARKKVR